MKSGPGTCGCCSSRKICRRSSSAAAGGSAGQPGSVRARRWRAIQRSKARRRLRWLSGAREGKNSMSDISRVALFGKLNSIGYKAVEGATVFCKLRGNPYVELVHWIHQIVQLQASDVHAIVRAFNLDAGRLAQDLTTT